VTSLVDPLACRVHRDIFFKLLFGRGNGYVCLAFLSAGTRNLREQFFEYPDELNPMLEAVAQGTSGNSVYFCPQLLDARKRTKEHVVQTPNAWSDLDTCHPDNLLVDPTVIVKTSPGRYQAYWSFDKTVDPDDAEALSRRIAYAHQEQGADTSGWDLTQLLRVPGTYNYKYAAGALMPLVEIQQANNNKYRLSDFNDYPEAEGYIHVDIPVPSADELPDKSAEELLQDRRLALNPLVWRHFTDEPISDWSKVLWNLQMLLYEAGFSRNEVFIIVQEAKCNKYARDGKPLELLWKEVCRAEARSQENFQLLTGAVDIEKLQLITSEEEELVASSEETFVERYQTWAKNLGDAAPQYHQAGAFIALSSLLAGAVRLPTSFGSIIPNLWFMILADTTLTRKSTAMDLAMDLTAEVDDDVLLATDGSLEGMMTSLAARSSRPSVFFRDEFSGLLEAMTRKDYMAGFAETLTKLYDGKPMKRLLRKEVVEVRSPILILFAGGIREKVCSLLTYEQVSSGFMPRFVFITAESDPTRIKPLGPPTAITDNGKAVIREELEGLSNHYHQTAEMSLKVVNTTITTQRIFDAQLTPSAWERYNQLETAMVEDGLKSERPEIMTPVNDRLSKSVLKAAVLLAASRQRGEAVTVELIDVLRAIHYGKDWKVHANLVMANVGRGTLERQIDSVLRAVERKPGVTRSVIMQNMHLTAQAASALFETMDQRGLIIRQRQGRTERLFPMQGRKK
jgi:hypothetical protein